MQFFPKNRTLAPGLSIPKTVKILAKILHFISSRIAVFFAAKLFTTPITFKTPKREKIMEQSAQVKRLKVDAIGKEIHILSYGFSDKKVLLAHGWSGRCTQLYMLAHQLLEKGFMVISFDGPAHGKSSGKSSNLKEYVTTVDAIHKEFGPFEAAVGHSFGAMGIVNCEAKNNIFKCIVTIGSGDKVSEILANFAHNLGLKTKFGKKLIQYFENKWQLKIDDFATSKAAKNVKIPVLVVHDVVDGDVFVSSAINIRQNLQQGSLLITNGLGHTKILRDPRVTNKITNFILQQT